MFLIAEMQSGRVFEDASKKKLTKQMIEHFAENDEEAGAIKAIYLIFKNDSADEICSNAVFKIQQIVDDGIREWRENARKDYEERRMIESDYLAGVL